MDTVIYVLVQAIQLYSWALIIYILMSWFPDAKNTSIGRFLTRICEPYLDPFRRIIPPLGMFDISPIVAFITLNLATRGLYQLSSWL
ncbi:YggT family protein [Domibacillus enclensis]|uniref:YggT family protein n=1 Tax=Domibacillus enclensis TaxID=1017273 RepID=A0A1N6UB94_9BACI|nr:YggT family protein [Domibacillus enclensis]OXS78482.1 YggT family protein [Domibacillus enclensis]SIQ62853.1 YggT family protein [Domibacillus enclensis]